MKTALSHGSAKEDNPYPAAGGEKLMVWCNEPPSKLERNGMGWLMVPDDLATLVEAALVAEHGPSDADIELAPVVRAVRIADVVPTKVQFLWSPYIPLGKLSIIAGTPGVGKSFITAAIASNVSVGRDACHKGIVVMLSTEDDLSDTIRPRLDSLGADVSNIYVCDQPITLDPAGLAAFQEMLETHHPALVTLDPLQSYLGGMLDMHRANETRPVLHRLKLIAERHACAIVLVAHTRKAAGQAVHAVLGSIDVTGAARSVLLAGQDPQDKHHGALIHVKSNVSSKGESIGFSLENGQFKWTGTTHLTADELLNGSSNATPLGEAREFLRSELSGGPVPSSEVFKKAKEQGISESTLRRAQKELMIRAVKKGKAWSWELQDSQDGQVSPI